MFDCFFLQNLVMWDSARWPRSVRWSSTRPTASRPFSTTTSAPSCSPTCSPTTTPTLWRVWCRTLFSGAARPRTWRWMVNRGRPTPRRTRPVRHAPTRWFLWSRVRSIDFASSEPRPCRRFLPPSRAMAIWRWLKWMAGRKIDKIPIQSIRWWLCNRSIDHRSFFWKIKNKMKKIVLGKSITVIDPYVFLMLSRNNRGKSTFWFVKRIWWRWFALYFKLKNFRVTIIQWEIFTFFSVEYGRENVSAWLFWWFSEWSWHKNVSRHLCARFRLSQSINQSISIH